MPSKYDTYFDIRAENRNMVAKCLQEGCNYTYKWDSHKSNYSLRTHLQNNHKDVFQKLVELEKKESATKQNLFTGSKQLSLTQCFKAEEKQLLATTVKRKRSNEMSEQPRVDKMLTDWTSAGDMTKKVTQAIAEMVCTDICSINIVTKPGFNRLMKIVAPNFIMPSRNIIDREISSVYERIKAKLNTDLKDVTALSISTDVWTDSCQKHSVISVLAHFLDQKMQSTHFVLAARHIKGAHTAINLSGIIANVLEEYSIPREKVQAFVRDGGMSATIRELDMESKWCFAHAVNDGIGKIGSFNELLENAKKFVRKVRKSRKATEEFEKWQVFFDLPDVTLKKMVQVRWNSIWIMLDSFLKNKAAVQATYLADKSMPYFSEDDWSTMRDLCDVLKPLQEATNFVQQRSSSLAQVIPLIKLIERRLITNFPSGGYIRVREAIVDGIKSRLPDVEDDKNFVFATILDPYFKMTLFKPEQRDNYKKWLIDELETRFCQDSQTGEIAINDEAHGMFDELRFDPAETRPESPDDAEVNNRLKLIHEIEHYLAKPPDQTFTSSAKFWNDPINSNMYPHLKELVKWYHSTPSSAAETERLFSIAKLILSDLRKRLSHENFEKLLILHSNLLLLNFSY
ncbi:zinc finger BED domain-containing protein 4 [Ditylenchus destructor]|uniref:Zinc finger BED domain-containing protein 4 n=1 Tax=Ditylenchus destructor TaxID=166010 RepID=A0AAD4R0P3_9BILA|nr:zinc finger BED domain-containing protein 4 [Ditylenchus destructor]